MKWLLWILLGFGLRTAQGQQPWASKHVSLGPDGRLVYHPGQRGDRIPDFSLVGYAAGQAPIPFVAVKTIVQPSDSAQRDIQRAIDSVSRLPLDKQGFRGAVLLRRGVYRIPGTLRITASGVVLRGEGEETVLVATGKGQRNLIVISGTGGLTEIPGTRVAITDAYVPSGVHAFSVANAKNFRAGDRIVVFRKGTSRWIHDLRMDAIDKRDDSTKQWQPDEYDLHFERTITRIEGNRVFIDNPVVMAMDSAYGGGAIYRYRFDGRIRNTGVEYLSCASEYASDTDEDHGWNAVFLNRVEDAWVRGVQARYFGYSCVNLGGQSKQVTVDSCRYTDPKSQITGGRRYSFNNDGQLNLVMHCFSSEGRHDYVTGARVCGPNVFYDCRSVQAKADIGPHHRWAMGTLYDHIVTDGEINIQDRGNWGTGHGWSGVNQVIWNCSASKAAIQDPWVSGTNYVIGLAAKKIQGRLAGRPQSEWEGSGGAGLQPASLYQAQLQDRKNNTNTNSKRGRKK
jgi:hypothetical protein